jgi:hypothetical protein
MWNQLLLRDFFWKAYTINQIVRMAALNCFKKLTSVNSHLNVVISYNSIGLSIGAKKKKKIQTNRVIYKLTLSFIPYPLFQWYLQSKEIF